MTNLANARTKFFIGGAIAASADETVFGAVTAWTTIADVTNLGEFGDEAEEISYDVIGDGRKRTQKGTRDGGSFDVTVARFAGDPGQTALQVGELASTPMAFKILLEDGTVIYFAGLVMSQKRKLAGANDIIEITYSIKIVSEAFEIEAA